MSCRRIGPILSLVRQGFELGIDFGVHSVEALLWVAETVENGVYRPHSLVRTADGVAFVLDNPPLRVGAFGSARVILDGKPVPPDRARVRAGPGRPWRRFDEISVERPLDLLPGAPTEVAIATRVPRIRRQLSVRLELRSVAIPPLVWLEFTDVARRTAVA